MEQLDVILQILFLLFAVVALLVFTYYATRWIAKRMSYQSSNSIIKILDRVAVGQDRTLMVIKVGGKTMLIGMAQGAIEKICDVEDLPESTPPETVGDFSDLFKDALTSRFGLKQPGKDKKEDNFESHANE